MVVGFYTFSHAPLLPAACIYLALSCSAHLSLLNPWCTESRGATLLGSGNSATVHRARLPLLPPQHGKSVHICVCRACAQLLDKPGAKCPLCRAVIEKVLDVFT